MKAERGKKTVRSNKEAQHTARMTERVGGKTGTTSKNVLPVQPNFTPRDLVPEVNPPPDAGELRDLAARCPLALGILAVCTALFFGRFLFTGRIFLLRDLVYDFYPMLVFLKEHLLAGTVPFWNPYTGCGEPYFSNIQAAPLYPLNLIHLLLPISISVTVSVALHALIAGTGVWFCCRSWRVSCHGSLLAAIAFSFSTLFMTRIEFYPSLCSYAWYPVAVAFFSLWLQGRRLWPLLAGASAMSLQVYAGYPETLLFTGGTMLIMAIVVAVSCRHQGISAVLRPFLGLAMTSIGALLLSMVQLLPVLKLLPETLRSLGGNSGVEQASVNPLMLLAAIFPFIYGGQGFFGAYWAPSVYEFWAGTFYVGILPVALCLTAAFRFFLGERRTPTSQKGGPVALSPASFLLAALLFFLLYAMGLYTPFFSVMWNLIPPLHWFRWPSKALLVVVFAESCLAGLALDWLGREMAAPLSTPMRRRLAAYGPATVLVGMAAFMVICLLDEGRIGKAILMAYFNLGSVPTDYAHRIPWSTITTDGTKFAAMTVASALLLLAHGHKGWRPGVLILMPIVLLADLMITTYPLLPSSDMDLFTNQGQLLAQIKAKPQLSRYYRQPTQQFAYGVTDETVIRKARDSFAASWAMVDKVYAVRAVGTFRLAESTQFRRLFLNDALSQERREFLARLMSCDMFLTGSLHPDYFRGEPPITPEIFSISEAVPRAFVVGRVRLYQNWKSLIEDLMVKEFNPMEVTRAVTGKGEGEVETIDPDLLEGNGLVPHRVTRLEDGLNRLTVEVESSAKGLLVVNDTFYDSWTATVNGTPAPIYEVNGDFRAVPVAAGKSVVEMRARSQMFSVGLAITVASLVLTGVLLTFDLRRGRCEVRT